MLGILDGYFESLGTEELNGDEKPLTQEQVQLSEEQKRLTSGFIDEMLKEPELVNELGRQNNRLLDFVCLGYFYDASGKRVQHIDYIIDKLLESLDKLDDKPQPTNSPQPWEHDQDEDKIESPTHNTAAATAWQTALTPDVAEQPATNSYLAIANTIAEILSLDVWFVTETLVKDNRRLERIWSILVHPKLHAENSPVVPIFLKINQNLLSTKPDRYLNFIRQQSNLVENMLRHITISVIMDFFLKLISTDKVESPTGIIELVSEQGLIDHCLIFLNNEKYPSDVQACVGDFLKALITISANAPIDDLNIGPNCLTRTLASAEIVQKLLDIMINEKGSALNTTVSIIIELIRKNNSDYDQVNLLETTIDTHPPSHRDPIYLGYLLRKFSEYLPSMFRIIIDAELDPNVSYLENQIHEKYKPLGFERFKIVELIAELLHCSNMGLLNTRKAERIAKERDQVRAQLSNQLQEALNELAIDESTPKSRIHKSSIDSHEDLIRRKKLKNNDDAQARNVDNDRTGHDKEMENDQSAIAEERDEVSDEEVDQSFEIPYVNMNQNDKLRDRPTAGDFFKIQLHDTLILPEIMKLFLSHPWNNFWHNVIFDIIQQLFNGRMDFSYNSFLIYSLFNLKGSVKYMHTQNDPAIDDIDDFVITKDIILRGYHNSYRFYDSRHMNLGYMGHLVLIAEEIVKFSRLYKVELISPEIHEALTDSDWDYYSEEVLAHTRVMYSKILGGGSYVDDGNGNIIPQLPGITSGINDMNEEDSTTDKPIDVDTLEEQLTLDTGTDLHTRLKEILTQRSQDEIDKRNAGNNVIILGPPPGT